MSYNNNQSILNSDDNCLGYRSKKQIIKQILQIHYIYIILTIEYYHYCNTPQTL